MRRSFMAFAFLLDVFFKICGIGLIVRRKAFVVAPVGICGIDIFCRLAFNRIIRANICAAVALKRLRRIYIRSAFGLNGQRVSHCSSVFFLRNVAAFQRLHVSFKFHYVLFVFDLFAVGLTNGRLFGLDTGGFLVRGEYLPCASAGGRGRCLLGYGSLFFLCLFLLGLSLFLLGWVFALRLSDLYFPRAIFFFRNFLCGFLPAFRFEITRRRT